MAQKKKKKAASNPARGFATTSVASKPKPEKQPELEAKPPPQGKENEESLPALQVHEKAAVPTQVSQTPEELEAQLEHDELQLLVEKHAAKTRREARRQVSKIQTDQRVLRLQAQYMTVQDWLPEDLLDSVIALAKAESDDSNRRTGQQSLLKVVSEEDAMSKLWTLDLVLKDLGFNDEFIQPALKWLCANASSVDPAANVWGLQESLEWLALDQGASHHLLYDESAAKSASSQSRDSSNPAAFVSSADKSLNLQSSEKNYDDASSVPAPPVVVPNPSDTADADDTDIVISDLDSDIEPDQLVPTYLKIKGRVFELDPDSLQSKKSKSKASKSRPGPSGTTAANSAATRKLLAQLQQIESDALFDPDEAESQWPDLRNQIAQEIAAKRDQARVETKGSRSEEPTEESSAGGKEQMEIKATPEVHLNHAEEDDSDASLLGDMFAAIPGETVASGSTSTPSDNTTLRDFGKQTGLSPRRILEEAIRARDPKARIYYKLVSPTTYACRHSLTIFWTRNQQLTYEQDTPGVTCQVRNEQVIYTAVDVSTVSEQQSESYISTVVLFSLFASSAKEEKLHLRLPAVWRELYKELLEYQKNRSDAADRLTIKELRTIIQDQVEQEETDGVVLTSRFRLRNQGNTSSPSNTEPIAKIPLGGLDSLKELWRQKESTSAFQRMLVGRNTLPVLEYRHLIVSTIEKNQVTIICGETGCGKSTQIPSFILENELSKGMPCKVFCTEPRRISAISLAQRVSEELGEGPKDLGTARSLVGYAIRLESKTSAQTRLIYATVGVVLRMLETNQRLEEMTHLIIDEVHERSIDTDFLLIILRTLMLQRPDLKVVLMSATVDAQRFSQYLDNAPILNIPGRTFPVQTKYLEDAIEYTHYSTVTDGKFDDSATSEDEDDPARKNSGIPSKLPGYSSSTRSVLQKYDEYRIDYDLIVSLIDYVTADPQLSHYSRAFLVFLPGIAEIRQINDALLGHPAFQRDWLIYPLHSTISSDDQQAAFQIPPPGVRKIVLATNIAETGVTIPDITCVIDTGKHKEMRFDERRQLSRLTQSFISRANAKQRCGRAGRVQEGLCFHLFTKYRHDNLMMDQQTPEMLRLSLQDLVMRTKICKLGDIERTLSEALDPPSSKNIRRAIDALIEVDALTPSEELTPLGRQLAKLPLDAHLGKLVLLSSIFNTVDVAITIAAILSSKSPFLTPFGAKQRADTVRLGFKKGDSDLLTANNAYRAWKTICTNQPRSELTFCHRNFLSAQNLANIEDLKGQLLSSLADAGFVQLNPDERRALSRYRNTYRHRTFVSVPAQYDVNSENDTLVTSVIATALYPKILTKDGKGWRNIANNQSVSLAPTSVNKGTNTAKFLSYYSIMQSSSKFYNAHSTSIAHALPMTLMVGADVDFKLHAGVITLPGNAVRFSVKDWRVCTALKVLRRRVKEIVGACWKNPGRGVSLREAEWMGLFFRVFEQRRVVEEKGKA